jgi:hypothetical protein
MTNFAAMGDFWTFLDEQAEADPARLLLSQRSWPELPSELSELEGRISPRDLAVNTLVVRRRIRKRLPSWSACPRLVYPLPLSAEQCSSEQTARYKARLAASLFPEPGRKPRIADLTGGLGVDALAFGQIAEEVLYSEMNPLLTAAARHNLKMLGARNIQVVNRELLPGKLAETLGGFDADLLFLDPGRRVSGGRKVFRLEDCAPDVLKLLPELLSTCRNVLLKLSPMADITRLLKQFETAAETGGNTVREIHVVASGGECKELLFRLDREYAGSLSLVCSESGNTMTFDPAEESQAACRLPADRADLKGYLFEPGKALLKAGMFNSFGSRFGLVKLGRHTHLYIAETPSEALSRFGNLFVIKEISPLNKRTIKEIGKHFPQADVSARNIPMSSEELAKRLDVVSGGGVHLFGTRVDFTSAPGEKVLLVCERLP